MLDIDHVILLVRDADAWSARFYREWGLNSCEGGTHPSGMRTRIVPLQPPQYIEMMELVATAQSTPFTALLAQRLDTLSDHFLGWAVRTDDIEREACRLRQTPQSGGGATVRWRTIRPSAADADHLPFFIQYDGDSATAYLQRRAGEVSSPARPGCFASIEVATDSVMLAQWLGDHTFPIRFASDGRGVRAVVVNSTAGPIEIAIH